MESDSSGAAAGIAGDAGFKTDHTKPTTQPNSVHPRSTLTKTTPIKLW